VEVEDHLVQGHRDRLSRLEANGRLEVLVLGDLRKLQLADDDLLVGHPETHVTGQRAGAEDLLEDRPERVRIDDLAVLHDPLWKLRADSRLDAAVGDGHSRQEIAIEVEPDAAARGRV
jgi:hypothetical protein